MKAHGLVIAHWDKAGNVRPDLFQFLQYIAPKLQAIIFVSTQLNDLEQQRLLQHIPHITVIQRPNIGYDFMSYKIGIEYLTQHHRVETLFIMNSSICILDPEKLYYNFFAIDDCVDVDIYGLTANYESGYHLQSYLYRVRSAVYHSALFQQWWQTVQVLENKDAIIQSYEIGFSRYFLQQGLILKALFEVAEQKNPTLYEPWKEIYARFGIAKWQLIEQNPRHQPIQWFVELVEQFEQQLALIQNKTA